MLRILKSPLRLPIPDAPASDQLERYRDCSTARVRLRCHVLLARRAGRLTASDTAQAVTAEASMAAVATAQPTHPVERICAAADVEALGVELLALVAVPYIDVAVRLQYAQLQRDVERGIDRETIRDLVSNGVSNALLASCLAQGGLFDRLGLVEVQAEASGRELVRATARLLALYDGQLASDPTLAQLVQWRECDRSDAEGVLDGSDRERVIALAADVVRVCTPPLLMIVGPSGTGRTRTAQAVTAGLGMQWLAVAEAPLLARDPLELAATLQRIEKDVRFLHGVLLIRGLDTIDPARRQVIASVLTRCTSLVMLSVEDDDIPELERLVAARQSVRRPPCALRRTAWSVEVAALGKTVSEDLVESLARNYPLTRSAIARAAELAFTRDPSLAQQTLELAAGSQVRSRLDRYAKRIVPTATLSDLVLAEDTREQIEELASAVRTRPELNRFLGEARSIGPTGIAALFNGPPGTGKTMTASALANTLGLPLYRIDVSSIVDRYVGETEKNLARVFEEAESERGLLLFDEADSLFTKRVEVSDSHDRYANMQVNMLLNLIDEYPGFVILTTNLKASIDTAFLRRMSFKVTFQLPEVAEREALWKIHIPREIPLARGVDLQQLAEQFRASGTCQRV